MAFDIYDTYYMLSAIATLPPEHAFFKNRYFPTNQSVDVFATNKVLVDFKQETLKMAEFTHPDLLPVAVGRDGFKTYELEPAHIAISRPLTIAQLQQRQFGESLMSTATPEERARMLLMGDLDELNKRITRTEEKLAIDTMIGNGTTIKQRVANTGKDASDYEDLEVKFYDGPSNPCKYTIAETWKHSKKTGDQWDIGNWYFDIAKMAKDLTRGGSPATDVIISPDVAEFLLEDPWFIEMMDNRRVNIAAPLDPTELGLFVYELTTINFLGKTLRILVDDGTYTDKAGKDQPYMPKETVIVTAPSCGKGLYGAITQADEQNVLHTYTGTRIPSHFVTRRPYVNEIVVATKPLFVPVRPNPWRTAVNVLTNP